MTKVKILNDFAVPGRGFTKDAIVELPDDQAKLYAAQGNAEIATTTLSGDSPATGANRSTRAAEPRNPAAGV